MVLFKNCWLNKIVAFYIWRWLIINNFLMNLPWPIFEYIALIFSLIKSKRLSNKICLHFLLTLSSENLVCSSPVFFFLVLPLFLLIKGVKSLFNSLILSKLYSLLKAFSFILKDSFGSIICILFFSFVSASVFLLSFSSVIFFISILLFWTQLLSFSNSFEVVIISSLQFSFFPS